MASALQLRKNPAIVMLYMDPIAPTNDPTSSATGLDWSPYTTTTIADDGSNLTMRAGTTPALNDPEERFLSAICY